MKCAMVKAVNIVKNIPIQNIKITFWTKTYVKYCILSPLL